MLLLHALCCEYSAETLMIKSVIKHIYTMNKEQTEKYETILKTLRRYRREGWELKFEDESSTPRQIAKARAVCEDTCDYMPDFIVDPQTGHKFINHNFVRNEC